MTFESSQMLTRHQRLSESYRSLFCSTGRLLPSFHFQSCIAEVWIRVPSALVNLSIHSPLLPPTSNPILPSLPIASFFVSNSGQYYLMVVEWMMKSRLFYCSLVVSTRTLLFQHCQVEDMAKMQLNVIPCSQYSSCHWNMVAYQNCQFSIGTWICWIAVRQTVEIRLFNLIPPRITVHHSAF